MSNYIRILSAINYKSIRVRTARILPLTDQSTSPIREENQFAIYDTC